MTERYRVTIEDMTNDGDVVAVLGIDNPDSSGICTVRLARRGGRVDISGCYPGVSWLHTVSKAFASLKRTRRG